MMGSKHQPTSTSAHSPVFVLQSPQISQRQKNRRYWNLILTLIASTAVFSSVTLTLYQTKVLSSLKHNNELSAEPPLPPPEPLRFIAVAGLYHSGTTAMWNSIRRNEHIAKKKGIDLQAYGMSDSGGYPACGVPLKSDSSVDMHVTMGNSSGIDEPNPHIFGQYGAMWADWHQGGPYTLEDVLKMKPPHEREVFYTWWKHTPPQHPMLACARPDTLYVIMVRHPKAWQLSMKRQLYDFKYEQLLKLWRLVRSDPRRLPPLEMRFRSLYNAWEFYIKGYASWENIAAGRRCYQSDSDGNKNCLGGNNKIPSDKRNILIVRYEDYLMNPKKVLAEIFSFASRGLINAKKEEDNFVPYGQKNLDESNALLSNMKEQSFFSVKDSDWEGATEITKICPLLGYDCNESPSLFIGNKN